MRHDQSYKLILLEIGAIDESAQFALENLAAALMRLEKSADPQAMLAAMRKLTDWLKAPARTRLRRSFTVWIRRVLLPARLPGITPQEMDHILEENTMLAERVREWTAQWQAEGWQKGRQKGRQDGLQEGRQEGLQEGLQEGTQKGQAQLLQTLLQARFGTLPDWALARLKGASTIELERWSLRLFDQLSLPEILE